MTTRALLLVLLVGSAPLAQAPTTPEAGAPQEVSTDQGDDVQEQPGPSETESVSAEAPAPGDGGVEATPAGAAEREADDADGEADPARLIPYFTGLLVVVGFLQVWAMFRQRSIMATQATIALAQKRVGDRQLEQMEAGLEVARINAEAARKSAEVADASMKTIQRPYVYIDHYRWTWHPDVNRPGRYFYTIRPVLVNAGPLATKDLRTWTQYRFEDGPVPDDFDFPMSGEPGPTSIGPHGSIALYAKQITDDELIAIRDRRRFFYVYGVATYHDHFEGTPVHVTRFCANIAEVYGDPLNPRPTEGIDEPSSVRIHFGIHAQHNSTS